MRICFGDGVGEGLCCGAQLSVRGKRGAGISGSRFAMGKAVEYGVPRYVIYDSVRDANDPMFNLSREAIATGAVVLDSEGIDCGKLSAHHGRMDQQEFSF